MYYSTATGYIIILSPLILLALLATIGIVLYRHPSKLQRKWYSVSFKKRKRIKQIAILLGFCMAAGLLIYPLTSKKQFVSTISLSANENNFITEDKIDQISEDRREIKNEQWLKKFYKMMKSDDESSTLLNDIGSYEVWKTSILEDKTGEYELRLRAEDTVLRRFSIQQSDDFNFGKSLSQALRSGGMAASSQTVLKAMNVPANGIPDENTYRYPHRTAYRP